MSLLWLISSSVCGQVELKTLQERLDVDKQHWEENYKKKEVCCIHVHSVYTRTCLSSVEGRGSYHSYWVTLRKTCLGFQVHLFQIQETNVKRKCFLPLCVAK